MANKNSSEEQELIAFEAEQHKVQVVEEADEHGQVCTLHNTSSLCCWVTQTH